MLGRKLGSIAQAQYLLMGLAGAPVFSNFAAGPAAFLRPSGGYLVGFMLGAYLTGLVWERSRSRSTTAAITAGIAGTAGIYLGGVCWLSIYNVIYGHSMAWMAWVHGVLPFIGVDAIKIVAAAVVVTGHSPLARKLRSLRVK
jgi:biotin transport system substrate-specific component